MTKRLISALILVLILFSVGVYAEEPSEVGLDLVNTARVTLEASEPDIDGYFTLKLIISNTVYKGILATIKYNSEAVTPVDHETKEATTDFSKFARTTTVAYNLETDEEIADWSIDIGSSIDTENSGFNIMNMVNIDQIVPNSLVSEKYQILAENEGLLAYTFMFQKLSDGKADFEINFDNNMTGGLGLIDSTGRLPVIFEIDLSDSLGDSSKIDVFPSGKVSKSKENPSTPEEKRQINIARAIGTVFLQINNYAAITNRAPKWIDKDNKSVVPYIKNGRTMVPLRFISEALGASVSYNDDTREITIKSNLNQLMLTVDEKIYYNDGLKRELDVPAEVVDGRTFVPVRFVSQALGKSVTWLQEEQMVIIASKEYPWDSSNEIEKELLGNAKLLMSPLVRDFAN